MRGKQKSCEDLFAVFADYISTCHNNLASSGTLCALRAFRHIGALGGKHLFFKFSFKCTILGELMDPPGRDFAPTKSETSWNFDAACFV
ncbi:hypothetical protein BaRGS_00010533 [Batillaria attramentaria]|uniref:Uncharacterized protein n=1 Tax=Batillaria attramentaria TaxID=370345 RepID=A0ABD0LGM7_9CAEN